MKKILFHVSSFVFVFLFSTFTFASMTFHGDTNRIIYNPSYPVFEGKIVGADYFYHNGKKYLGVSLKGLDRSDPSKAPRMTDVNVEILFSDADIGFGIALASNMGNPSTVFFANEKFEIEQVHVNPEFNHAREFKMPEKFKMPQGY